MVQRSKATLIAVWILAYLAFFMVPVNARATEGTVTQITLNNGLELLVAEDHNRKVVSLQLWVKVGSADEEPSERGISHLIEHMAFKGTARRGVGEIAAEVEGLGGDINAYTSWDETVFHITAPSSATFQGLDILIDAVLRPTLDPNELEKEKQVVLEEILEGDERPATKSSKLLFETAYVQSPYRFPIIGYKEIVEKMTRDDIIAFRKKWYVPENMFLLVVGDVDTEAVRSEVERLTEDLKPVGFFRPPRPVEPLQRQIRSSLVRDRNARETRLHMAYHIPSIRGNDVNALDLAADILGARENSRLVRVLKKEKRLVNAISAFALTPKDPGLMAISATLDAKNLEAAINAIISEVDLLAKEPPSAEELERAKIHIESQHVYEQETVQGIARNIGNYAADLGDPYYGQKYLRLNSLVTPGQISRVVSQYMAYPNATVTVLIPEGDRRELRIAHLTDIVASKAMRARTSSPATGSVAGVAANTLPNGVRVVLVSDPSNPVVSFRIAHLGGKRFESEEYEGIMNFLARMLDKGAGNMTEDDIARKVDEMGGRLYGFSGYDSFGVSANFFSRHLHEALELLWLIHSHPTFPEEKVETERKLIINRIETEPDRPVTYTVTQLLRVLFPAHPYGHDQEGTLATVSGFTRDDLIRAYERFAVPSNTVITAVGDMDLRETMDQIAALFGRDPAKPLDVPEIPEQEPLTKVDEEVVRIPRAKAHVAIGFRGTKLADADRYPMDVLNNLLAGQGGRLFVELRDKQSLAYVVTSFVRPGLDPGIFALYIACETSKMDRATQGLIREIQRIRQGPVGDEELRHAINNLTGNHMIALQSSLSRAETRALNTLYGLGYDYDAEYIEKIKQVKAEQVLAVARRYLDLDRCAIVKILPEENEDE